MSYAILSDDTLLQLEAAEISRDARLLYVEGLVYCATALTDGLITIRLTKLSDAEDTEAAADELIEAGLWSRDGKSYIVEDYHEHQPTADEVRRKRAESRLRAERSRLHKRGDHSMCIKGRYCPQGSYSPSSHAGNAHGARDVRSPTLPNPSLTDPKEGKGRGLKAKSGVPAAAAQSAAADTPCQRHLEVVDELKELEITHVKRGNFVSGEAIDVFEHVGKQFFIATSHQVPYYLSLLEKMPDEGWTFAGNEQPRGFGLDEKSMQCAINLTSFPADERVGRLLDIHEQLRSFLKEKVTG
jgi:hypothetical protein